MSQSEGRRTQDTFVHKRFVWPYILTTFPDGKHEVEVRDAICPRCRARASYSQNGERVMLQCRRCNISANYSPFGSYEELKDHVSKLILDKVEGRD